MQLLFVPYKTGGNDADGSDATEISPQKHAAREHHRKAKLLKQVARDARQNAVAKRGGNPLTKTDLRETLDKGASDLLEDSWRVVLQAKPQSLLGAGRLDPFETYCVTQQPLMVHEILDHGKSVSKIRPWWFDMYIN
jgi:hypothetical protein